ncbi:hypothetical protein ACOMHN_011976 [Nucella lapillus]
MFLNALHHQSYTPPSALCPLTVSPGVIWGLTIVPVNGSHVPLFIHTWVLPVFPPTGRPVPSKPQSVSVQLLFPVIDSHEPPITWNLWPLFMRITWTLLLCLLNASPV